MARRKVKKTKRKSSKSRIPAFIPTFFSMAWKIFPLTFAVIAAGGIFFGVKGALYADPRLSIKEVAVYPPFALNNGRREDLETKVLGKNIFKVDLENLAAKLQDNPEVQTARVSRKFPASLSVYIKTRRPVALIQFSPKSSYGLMSEDGMILDVLKQSDPSYVLVQAYGMGITSPTAGRKIKNPAMGEVTKFLNTFWHHSVSKREPLTGISIDHLGNVAITLGEGPNIRLGKRPSERIETLEKMMYLLEGESRASIEYVDLQYDNVIVKRKQ